jgi:hypothetical protein
MNNHRNGYGWDAVLRKLIWCSWPPRSPDLFLWGYVRSAVFIPSPPTDIHKLEGRVIETALSVIRGLLTKVCEETDYRADNCRLSSGAHYPGPVKLGGTFHRFFNDLRLLSLINAILNCTKFEKNFV